ncbi:hypothetical protein SHab15497_00021 [Acinetobacter phage SH-Ab 15497]|nr:hypothetical protein SHab15497_00021 [Acinetobacter phage SH-Ab 15497]
MSSSQLAEEFKALLIALNTIMLGDETQDMEYNGVIKPTWSKWLYQNRVMITNKADQAYVDSLAAAWSGGYFKSYPDLTTANADIANIPLNVSVKVLSEQDGGEWYKSTAGATQLSKSPFDPLRLAKIYADTVAAASMRYSETLFNVVSDGVIGLAKGEHSTIIPILTDGEGKALAYYDTEDETFKAGGLLESIFNRLIGFKLHEDPRYLALLTDESGKILIGWDKLKDEMIGGSGGGSSFASGSNYVPYKYNTRAVEAQKNHVLSYGQSLSVGAQGIPVITTSQPYSNETFGFVMNGITYSSPRMDVAATLVRPLFEVQYSPSSDGYNNNSRGETHCSGMANYSSYHMAVNYGRDPSSHVIFASTAGHGGYRIDQLKKGSAWYSVLMNHVTKGKELNVGFTYAVQAIPWQQGENNAFSSGVQTPYAEYKPELIQLQSDAENDIKAITGQTGIIPFITYQMSYAARTWPDIAKVQLDLVRENDRFMLSTPMYHLPYANDNIHLNAIGYKWLGAYIARAYNQYMFEGRKSDFINPKHAYIDGNRLRVKFDVPAMPLVLDEDTLAKTVDYGFVVKDGSNKMTIVSIMADGDEVIIDLNTTPTGAVTVRYAMDNLAAGVSITGGASGNLRDSTTDTTVIANNVYPLYHVCPHFELPVTVLKGI